MAPQPQAAGKSTPSKRRHLIGLVIYLYCICVIALEVGSLIKGGIHADTTGTSGQVQTMQMLALLFASLGFFFSGLFLLVDMRRNPRKSGPQKPAY